MSTVTEQTPAQERETQLKQLNKNLRTRPQYKTAPSFARSPKSGIFERVLARGCEMGERGEERVARPGGKGNGERAEGKDFRFSPHFFFLLAARLLPRPVLPYRAPKLAQKPRFSDFWRRKGLFCSLIHFTQNEYSDPNVGITTRILDETFHKFLKFTEKSGSIE